jgi:hypothetical protein
MTAASCGNNREQHSRANHRAFGLNTFNRHL